MQEMKDKRRLYDTISYAIKVASIAVAVCALLVGWLTASIWYALGVLAVAVVLFVVGPKLVDQARDDLKMGWHEIVSFVYWFEVVTSKNAKEVHVWSASTQDSVVFQHSQELENKLSKARRLKLKISFEQRLSPVTHRYIGRNLELCAP